MDLIGLIAMAARCIALLWHPTVSDTARRELTVAQQQLASKREYEGAMRRAKTAHQMVGKDAKWN